jgi:hypothetical protein
MRSDTSRLIGATLALAGGFWAFKSGLFSNLHSKVFGADQITPTDAERIDVERTGLTADVVPESLVSSFMGYRFLDLAHTSAVVNERPWGTGVTDDKSVYVNGYDLGYSDDQFSAENVSPVRSLTFGADNNYYGPNVMDNTPGQLPRSVASKVSSPDAQQHEQVTDGVVSLDPATGQTAGINYQGPVPCCTVPPEVNRDFAFAVTGVNAPFVMVPEDGFGANRFGSLTRNSDASSVNGRFGKVSLSPDQDASYVDTSTGKTMSLSSWRNEGTIIQSSDTEVSMIPKSGGMTTYLRRV